MGFSPSQTFAYTSGDLRVPPGTRLLHIGPFKTGTSALQGAFAQSRDELAEHGVSYPAGALRHWLRPTIALTGTLSIRGHPKAKPRHWQQLVDAFEQAGDQTILHSCEFFSDCEPEHIDRAICELGKSRPVHVVVTVRPLAKILPSQWQMHIQDGWIHTPYDTWLRQIFADEPIEPDDPTTRFWHRHDHAELASRWARIVGPENITVITADPNDRHAILRPFESILGLPTGLLEFEPGHTNDSLPYGGTELLRDVNREFVQRHWHDGEYGRLIRHGATARMRAEHDPLPTEQPTRTPQWAHQRAVEVGTRIADDLASLGVRVAGDLDNLRVEPESDASRVPSPASDGYRASAVPDGSCPPDALLTADAASQFAIGILERQSEHTAQLQDSLVKARKRSERAEQRFADEQSAKELLAEKREQLAEEKDRLAEEKDRLAEELAAARKALDPAQPEQRRAIDVDSPTLLRFVARRVARRLRRPLRR